MQFEQIFDAVMKNRNKAKKTFIKPWLVKRKANIKYDTQAQKRKHPNHKHEWLDSEEDDIINKATSAKINAVEGTETEFSNAKDD
jgi:hypothetical protein